MSKDQNKALIFGNKKDLLSNSILIGESDPKQRIEITVVLRRKKSKDIQKRNEKNASQMPRKKKHLTREEFQAKYGADPKDIAKVEIFARKNNLQTVKIKAPQHSIIFSGTSASLSSAFGVKLNEYRHPDGNYRGIIGEISVPADLASVIQGVFGLDNRPVARPHFRRIRDTFKDNSSPNSFSPNQLARLYDFPSGVNGTGQCIAIIELGGGYSTDDLTSYFTQLGIPIPNVSAVSVDGGTNSPTGNPDGPDGEVMLDIEVVGAISPGAKIVVYFAPNTDQGFLDAIGDAIHDSANKPSVISISWGGPESSWSQQALQSFNDAFQSAAALGITVCAAAGDNGSSDGVGDGLAHVDFPASSPFVMACGGTRVNSTNNTITSETVWNDLPNGGATGGGISDVFDLPSYQTNSKIPPSANPGNRIGRGMPDISGDADPVTGYAVIVDGQNTVIGGTSAVAPLYAALTALVNQSLGNPMGDIHSILYSKLANTNVFEEITMGNNGAYSAHAGWNACTGLGRLEGTKFLDALQT